jgi:hypothetical protein
LNVNQVKQSLVLNSLKAKETVELIESSCKTVKKLVMMNIFNTYLNICNKHLIVTEKIAGKFDKYVR